MESSYRAALDNVKALHSEFKEAIESGIETSKLKKWKQESAKLHRHLKSLQRNAAADKESNIVTMAIMREEIRNELVQREAISARTAERFRLFCSRGSTSTQTAFDRAARTALAIEECVGGLSCGTLNCSKGTSHLYRQAVDDGD